MAKLEGKVAIITGSSGGIGSATAAKFLAEGAQIMLAGRDLGRLEAAQNRLNGGANVA